MVIIEKVIEELVSAYADDLPSTEADERVNARKEGLIGKCLAVLTEKSFRRFHDSLMVFTGKKYERLTPEDIKRVVRGFMVRIGCGAAYLARSINSICSMIMDHPFLKDFEPRHNIIYMSNCVLVIGDDGGIMTREFSPEYMSNIYLDFPYIEGMGCPSWERFLATVLEEREARMVLQEFLGCMFVDKETLSIEKALFLYGSGANGKSVVYETLDGMLGENITNASLDQLNSNTGEYYAADWVGKLLAFNSDADARDVSSGKYKQLISKERVTVRHIRQAPFESADWPMFMASINKRIITTDSTEGFWRRNMVIGFNKTFVDNPNIELGQLKANRGFKSSMRGEYPGIFNWILEGRRRILANKGVFTRSKSVEELTEDMKTSSTAIYSFLAEKGYKGVKPLSGEYQLRRRFAKDLYNEYRLWCEENGYRDKKNINNFKDDVVNQHITWKKSMKIDGQVSSGYIFYEVRPVMDNENETELKEEEEEDMPWYMSC